LVFYFSKRKFFRLVDKIFPKSAHFCPFPRLSSRTNLKVLHIAIPNKISGSTLTKDADCYGRRQISENIRHWKRADCLENDAQCCMMLIIYYLLP